MAQLLVVALLGTWQVPVLDGRSVTRCFDAIADPTRTLTVSELAALTRRSESSLLRHVRATTGLTPDQFRRWVRTLAARSALLEGEDPGTVAARHGFATVRAMHRLLTRVERTTDRLPRARPRSPLAD